MSNLLGVAAVLVVAAAITLLASWPWALLYVGIVLHLVAWVATTHETRVSRDA